MFKHNKNREEVEESDYWVSFTDLMSALVIILIFAIVFLMIQRGSSAIEQKRTVAKLLADINFYQTKNSTTSSEVDLITCEADAVDSNNVFAQKLAVNVNQYSELVEERNNTVHRMSNLLQREGLAAKVSNDGTSIVIPTDQLSFKQGQYEIPDSKRPLIEAIAEILYFNLVPDQRHKVYESVEIIGHTDSAPAKGMLFQNWGLSVHRAASFWEKVREVRPYGKELSSLVNWKGEALFSISGFGATRPLINDDDRPEEQKVNRRIEIRFGVKQFSDREMSAMSPKFDNF
ncbi:MAG TPA: hypothetical protein DHW71_06420 [Gammaproteobacteria bacterium]|nr:hypothetical protein [Gammaproteobacteria bacterium]MEC8011287.1 hypothetical protein [Pseudomonadota bacterium]HBF09532.1 hypothetical protein [Gammaproteobacteria bacterium]HCK92599.1 hypothetical protein [Gammaproteobacteria bacterium]|tara:strand:- start:1928 stop:2794 length:867 start_codon:yes stop_codon:yes gene_type:complete